MTMTRCWNCNTIYPMGYIRCTSCACATRGVLSQYDDPLIDALEGLHEAVRKLERDLKGIKLGRT